MLDFNDRSEIDKNISVEPDGDRRSNGLVVAMIVVLLAVLACIALGFLQPTQSRAADLRAAPTRIRHLPAYDLKTANVDFGAERSDLGGPRKDLAAAVHGRKKN